MLKNAVDLYGVSNARELGGYAAGGKYIRKGVLIRTGGLNGASPEALAALREKYNLQTIVDFRMKTEQESRPDPDIEGAEKAELSVVEFEDYHEPDPEFMKEFIKPERDRMKLFELSYNSGAVGYDAYDIFLLGERGKAAYREFFSILLGADPEKGAVLWHCTDGKDRTGCAAMLLLSALGASRETIMEDYLLTNVYNAAGYADIQKKADELGLPPEKRDALIFMSGCVVGAYMEHAFSTLGKEFGSVTGYLRDMLGVGETETVLLKEKYLCGRTI